MNFCVKHDNWQRIEKYYPVLKYVPKALKRTFSTVFLKPKKIPWVDSLGFYILPVPSSLEYITKPNKVIPYFNIDDYVTNGLITSILIDILPQLAKLANVDYNNDVLLIYDLDAVADVRFIMEIIKPWRNVILKGNNKLKLKWWQDYCLNNLGQFLYLKDIGNSANVICGYRPFVSNNCSDSIKLNIISSGQKYSNNNVVSDFRINIKEDFPDIIRELYGEYIPWQIVEQYLIVNNVYHKELLKWYYKIKENFGTFQVDKWVDSVVYLSLIT